MANYTSNLKTWGSTGQEPPDNYNYVEGEQPVDAWDNWLNSNVITDLEHLINLTNARLADENGAESSTGGVRLQNGEWVAARNNADSGDLNLWRANSSDVAQSNLPVQIGGDLTAADGEVLWDESSGYIPDARLQHDYIRSTEAATEIHTNHDLGTVPAGDFVPLGTFGLDDGDTLEVTQASLTENGYDSAAPSGINLVIATDADSASPSATILSGDGTTMYDYETGSPLAEYSNSSGGHQTAVIALNNGDFGQSGVGSAQQAQGGFISRVV